MSLNNNNKELNDGFEKVIEAVEGIKYGSVTLIIQDGVIIQIDKNEKIRLK
ncbi:YezD family protein [Clostridium paraputrificum]|uniref:YezD family protein n=1 Tax=Clostridium TaxID=1485 RepID=UPI003D359A12